MIYRFEDCRLDTQRRELRRGAGHVDLEPQVFDLLEFLIRTRDRVASRDDLLLLAMGSDPWPGQSSSIRTVRARGLTPSAPAHTCLRLATIFANVSYSASFTV